MKKFIALLAALTLLSIGAMAFAHGGGYGGGYGGGPGYGCGGPGYGGGCGGGPGHGGYKGRFADTEEGKKFLEETADLRKKIHDKKFDLKEAYRKGDEKKAAKIEGEIDKLREKLYEKAEKAGINKKRGYGRGYGRGHGGCGSCGGPGYGY